MGNTTTFSVWAPLSSRVKLLLDNQEELNLEKADFGFWERQSHRLQEGVRYKLVLDDQEPLPDPASRFQPEGVHGFSEWIDLEDYKWKDQDWHNPPLNDYIIYELHVGTFLEKGTFDGIITKLPYLVDLGITAIELMPVAQFPGERNWGYDGVFPFAVQHSYGGPKALQRLVDACHAQGIAVILDVVYNHLGPEGNYLEAYGPYFTDKYGTPWGKAVNLDDAYCDGVRHYLLENMLMWFRDFHIDALRLDAVHALKDFGAKHLLAEMRNRLDALGTERGSAYYLIGECDLNDVRYLRTEEEGGYGLHGQWIDEFHHALRVSVGEPRVGYYADFEPLEHLAKSFTDAYVYDGVYSPHRKRTFGNKAIGARGEQFVVFSQNHDQVGNRMLGERSSTLYGLNAQKLMAAVVLSAPFVPLLFMGEEYGEQRPFQYFVSHTDVELAEAVREGRRKEFNDFHGRGETPDPMAVETFERSKLNWSLLEVPAHQEMLKGYKTLIALRKQYPAWRRLDRECVSVKVYRDEEVIQLERWDAYETLFFFFNFSKQSQEVPAPFNPTEGIKIFDTVDSFLLSDKVSSAYTTIKMASQSASIYHLPKN